VADLVARRSFLRGFALLTAIVLVSCGAGQTAIAGNLSDQKLTDSAQIRHELTKGPTVKVVVNLDASLPAPSVSDFAPGASSLGPIRAETKRAQQRVLDANPAPHVRPRYRFDNIPAFSAEVTAEGLAALQARPDVASIEPVFLTEAHLAQGIPLLRGTTYRSTHNGAGLAIAICDTGIDYNHPRLGGGGFPNAKVLGGYDFGDSDSNPIPNGQAHGTCCAGIAAGDLGTVGSYIGGVAYSSKLYALKISYGTGGSAYSDAMAAAWDWCVTHRNDNPDYPIKVISTSFGGGRYYSTSAGDNVYPSMTTAANNAVAAGITVLASSGNDGYCDSMGWPACISSVLSVGAVYDAAFGNYQPCISADSCAPKIANTGCSSGYYAIDATAADKVTSYSNTATFLTLLAPSNACYTTDITGSAGYSTGDYYTSFGGTSAACPYAAGAAACLQSAAKAEIGRWLTPLEVKNLLTANGDAVTDSKVAITKPRVNLERAIEALLRPTVVTQPLSQLKEIGESAVFSVQAIGSPPLNYQWRMNGADLSDGPTPSGSVYGGAMTASLTLTGVQGGDSGNYDCVVTNAHGSATSDAAALTINNLSISPPYEYTWCVGQSVTDCLGATGGTAPYHDWTVVPSVDDDYTYSVLGSSLFGSTGSARGWKADDASWQYALPFAFPFYGIERTVVNVCSNGFLDFTGPTSAYSNSALGLISGVRIAPLWDDLNTTSGNVYIDESVPGQVTIRWDGVTYSGSYPVRFSAVLFSDGWIRFDYGSGNTNLTPTIGISSGDGLRYILVSGYDGASSRTNANSVAFTPVEPLSPLPPGVNLNTGTGCFTGQPTTVGDYSAQIQVYDSSSPTLTRQQWFTFHVVNVPPPVSVSTAKLLGDAECASLSDVAVTFSSPGYFYVQEDDRTSGIRVVKSGHGLSAGARVDVEGVLGTSSPADQLPFSDERYIDCGLFSQVGSGMTEPLGMSSALLGGADWYYEPTTNAGQRGVTGGSGLNTVGMLIAVTGRVTYVTGQDFGIDDGAGRNVRCFGIGETVSVGEYVTVTGISTLWSLDSVRYPGVVVRSVSKSLQTGVFPPYIPKVSVLRYPRELRYPINRLP